MKVAKLQVHDIPLVLETSAECGLCLWSANAYRAELARGDSIMLKATTDDGEFAGFAVGRIFELSDGLKSVELTNIGTPQAFRGQRVGSLLLRSFLERCRAARASTIILEVRESNDNAIQFYEHFGFSRAGRRKSFYSDPQEDALTMSLALTTRT